MTSGSATTGVLLRLLVSGPIHRQHSVCGETGIRRIDSRFGHAKGTYRKLPPLLREGDKSHAYLCLLSKNLQGLLELLLKVHLAVIAERHTLITKTTQMSEDGEIC